MALDEQLAAAFQESQEAHDQAKSLMEAEPFDASVAEELNKAMRRIEVAELALRTAINRKWHGGA